VFFQNLAKSFHGRVLVQQPTIPLVFSICFPFFVITIRFVFGIFLFNIFMLFPQKERRSFLFFLASLVQLYQTKLMYHQTTCNLPARIQTMMNRCIERNRPIKARRISSFEMSLACLLLHFLLKQRWVKHLRWFRMTKGLNKP